MEEWLLNHLWKILSALGAGVAFAIGWCFRIRWDVNSLKQTRETFKECLPQLKSDVAQLKTEQAVDKAILERMETTLERIENKLDGN